MLGWSHGGGGGGGGFVSLAARESKPCVSVLSGQHMVCHPGRLRQHLLV